MQTKLQTNCAALNGIRQYKAGSKKPNWRTRPTISYWAAQPNIRIIELENRCTGLIPPSPFLALWPARGCGAFPDLIHTLIPRHRGKPLRRFRVREYQGLGKGFLPSAGRRSPVQLASPRKRRPASPAPDDCKLADFVECVQAPVVRIRCASHRWARQRRAVRLGLSTDPSSRALSLAILQALARNPTTLSCRDRLLHGTHPPRRIDLKASIRALSDRWDMRRTAILP